MFVRLAGFDDRLPVGVGVLELALQHDAPVWALAAVRSRTSSRLASTSSEIFMSERKP